MAYIYIYILVEFNPCPKCHQNLSKELEEKVTDIINKIDHLPETMNIGKLNFSKKNFNQ